MKYGFYSPKCAKLHGTVFWSDLDGNKVEVTFVNDDPDGGPGWDDKVAVGEVVEFVGPGRRGSSIQEEFTKIKL